MTTRSGFDEDTTSPFEIEPPTQLDTPRFLAREELEALGRKADAWLDAHKGLVDALPTGTIILINIGTGEHVTALTRDEARALFDARFGAATIGHYHCVRQPITVGGGWWALHSEA